MALLKDNLALLKDIPQRPPAVYGGVSGAHMCKVVDMIGRSGATCGKVARRATDNATFAAAGESEVTAGHDLFLPEAVVLELNVLWKFV